MKSKAVLGASLIAMALSLSATAGASAQTITQALTAAYQYAPDLQSALLNAKSSAESIALAEAGKRPTIGASLSGSAASTLAGGAWSPVTGTLTTGVSVNQMIYDNFKTDAQIEAARAAAEVAEYQIRSTEQNVLLAVVQAYMQVLTNRQLVSLRAENNAFFEAQLQSARDRLDVGEGTRIDVAQAEARLAQGQAAFRAAQSSLQISEATFARYVGAQPGQLSPTHNFAQLIPRSLDTALAEAEAGHPAILMSKAGIRAAQAGSEAAKAAFGPTADMSASVGSSWSQTNATSQGGFTGTVRFNVTVPIYAGGALGASVRKANIAQIKSEVDAMSAYDQVRQSVISAWAGIQSADAQIQAANAGVAASTTVVEGVIQERDLGTSTTLDVLNSRAELTTARESLINASSNKVIATFSLLAAMGRLTATDLGLPVEVKTAVPYTEAVQDVWQELRSVPQ